MLLKANYMFSEDAEHAAYCILQYYNETYHSYPSTVEQTERGWKIQLKKEQQLVFILVVTHLPKQKANAELFLPEDGDFDQAWVDRTTKAVSSCKGRLTY